MFGTLQDRLPKELKLAGITDIEAANRFIREIYLPAHNARFARPPEIAESAFVAADPGAARRDPVRRGGARGGRDNTVAYGGLRLQLPQSRLRAHYVKAKVKVRQYPDGTLAVFHGPRCSAATMHRGTGDRRPDLRHAAPRARRRQGVAWKRRGRRHRRRDGQP